MGLKIRYERSGYIRSVGDAPNGILAVMQDRGEPKWIVHPKVDDSVAGTKGSITVRAIPTDPFGDGAVALSPEDVFEACDDIETAQMMWTVATAQFILFVEGACVSLDIEWIQRWADFLKDCRDQLAVNGYIAPPPSA